MEKKFNSASVDSLIALCNIIDYYADFSSDLKMLITSNFNREVAYNLNNISHGKNIFGASKIKKFYEKHRKIVDIINEYSSIFNFINSSCDCQENLNDDFELDFFYKYILKHRDKIDVIVSVLNRVKKLGFDFIQFNENFDFTNNEYHVYTNFGYNSEFSYFDNIEIIPNYQVNVALYRTNCSNFQIKAKVSFDKISEYEKIIMLNSLVFNPNRLPESLTVDETFNKIIKLREENFEDCNIIKKTIDFGVSVDDLCCQFNNTCKLIWGIDDIDSKDELKVVLEKIKENLEHLKSFCSDYEDDLLKKNPSLSKERLDLEKKLYLDIRNKFF